MFPSQRRSARPASNKSGVLWCRSYSHLRESLDNYLLELKYILMLEDRLERRVSTTFTLQRVDPPSSPWAVRLLEAVGCQCLGAWRRFRHTKRG